MLAFNFQLSTLHSPLTLFDKATVSVVATFSISIGYPTWTPVAINETFN